MPEFEDREHWQSRRQAAAGEQTSTEEEARIAPGTHLLHGQAEGQITKQFALVRYKVELRRLLRLATSNLTERIACYSSWALAVPIVSRFIVSLRP